MNIQRSWATPVAAGAFLLSAVTGVLIFFHVDSGLNKAAHEWLSWLLLGGVVLHVLANLGGFKRHFASRGGLAVMGAFALALALSFIAPAAKGEPPFMASVRALSDAPLSTLALVARQTPEALRAKLAWTEDLIGRVDAMARERIPPARIAREVLGPSDWTDHISRGEYSRANLVRAILREGA